MIVCHCMMGVFDVRDSVGSRLVLRPVQIVRFQGSVFGRHPHPV